MVPCKRKWFLGEAIRITRFSAIFAFEFAFESAIVIALFVLFALPAQAQDDARQKYEASLKQWKATYVETLKSYSEFQICEESESDELRRQFLALKKKGDDLEATTVLAAADCVEAAVTPDPELIEFLVDVPVKFYKESRYKDSARVGRALLKHDPRNFALIYNTVRSAFFANDFDYAGQLFDKWIELEGSLPPELQPLHDSHKQLSQDWKRELDLRQAEALQNILPRIEIETTKGRIVVEFFENEAPEIVNNLMWLVEDDKNPFFVDMAFFFVLKHQLAVTGSPSDDGSQVLPLGRVTDDLISNRRSNFRGSVSLDVREIPGGGFMIVTGIRFLQVPQDLDRSSLVIGRVIEGMDVVDRLEPMNEINDNLETVPIESAISDRVIRVSVLRKPEGKVYKPIDAQ